MRVGPILASTVLVDGKRKARTGWSTCSRVGLCVSCVLCGGAMAWLFVVSLRLGQSPVAPTGLCSKPRPSNHPNPEGSPPKAQSSCVSYVCEATCALFVVCSFVNEQWLCFVFKHGFQYVSVIWICKHIGHHIIAICIAVAHACVVHCNFVYQN